MTEIFMPNEEKRPTVVCGHCKKKQILDIREFNKDMTRISQFTCYDCRKTIYAGILLVANTNLNSLMQNIQSIVDAVGAKNTLRIGDPGGKIN